MANNSVPNEYLRVARVMKALFDDWQDQNKSGEWWCNTGLLDTILISDFYTARGCSEKLRDCKWQSESREHVIPRLEIAGRCFDMFSENKSIKDVADFLHNYLIVVYVTTKERKYIDSKSHYCPVKS